MTDTQTFNDATSDITLSKRNGLKAIAAGSALLGTVCGLGFLAVKYPNTTSFAGLAGAFGAPVGILLSHVVSTCFEQGYRLTHKDHDTVYKTWSERRGTYHCQEVSVHAMDYGDACYQKIQKAVEKPLTILAITATTAFGAYCGYQHDTTGHNILKDFMDHNLHAARTQSKANTSFQETNGRDTAMWPDMAKHVYPAL